MEKDQALEAVRQEKLCQARERHGKPFAYEAGSNWKPRSVPLLTEWLQSRGRDVVRGTEVLHGSFVAVAEDLRG